MKERGINNTFKKIIFESSEMVFLADDSYPYNIFYSNQAFENQIGQFLDDRSLVGLGLDINSYIFNEELILPFMGVEYTFFLELPQENASNYFLFYKGKEMRGQGLPTKTDSQYFFRNSIDLIGIGQESFLTWISNSVKPLLGYNPEEIVNIELCSYFHPDDYEKVKTLLFDVRQERKNSNFISRILTKNGDYRWFEFNVHFIVGKFYAVGRDITQIQSQIVDSQNENELYALGGSLAQIGFWEMETDEQKVHLSNESFSILGLKKNSDLTLEETINLFSPADRSLVKTSISALLSSGQEFNLSLELKGKENGVKWVKFSGKKIILSNKESKVFGTVQDITDEHQKLNELGVFKDLFELSPDAVLISDISGKILFYNQLAGSTYGDLDFVGFPERISDIEPLFSDKEIWGNHVEQLTANGNIIYQSSFRNAKGVEISVEVSTRLSQIQDATYLISNFREVHDRPVSAGISSGSSAFLQHLTEQIPGALYQFVIEKEGDMKFTYLSPGIKQLLGLSENELADFNDVGKAISKVHPEDIADVLTSTVSSARKLSSWHCRFRILEPGRKNYKWVMGAARPEQLDNGDVVWHGYLTDVTDQKIFEDKLRNAKEEALKASQIKSEFLSIISHELRTPLNAISGSVYSLLQDDHTTVQASAYNTINFAVENLITMINDLLDFQKIEAGKLTLEMIPINIEEVVKNVINGLEYHAKDSGNKLILNIKNDLNFEVKGDKVRLSQVLNNLVTNALKFTNNGIVEVIVELKETSDEKVKAYFEVKDNGIGIAEEHKNRIFNEFDQIQHSFSKKYGGTGLGLSITKKLLGLMGSDIDLRSELGLGSSFFFEIEFEKINPKTSARTVSDNTPFIEKMGGKQVAVSAKPIEIENKLVKQELQPFIPEPPVVFSKPKSLTEIKLLMAEDNDVNALVLGKIIKKWGIHYHRVNNGKLAVEAIEDGEYDCILMDIQMPVMNGFEATERIKEISNVPILALSAADKIEVMDRIDKTGFDGYVAKPIDASELLRKIKEVLKIENQSA
jgi:PAS domain S-box-containing protein